MPMAQDEETTAGTSAEGQSRAKDEQEPSERGVMSFGEHLEELRSCSIRALIGVGIACAFSLVFAKQVLAFVLRPALVVLEAHGQRASIQALSPPDTFLTYLKMALLTGLIIAMPWVLMQIWRFVSLGLYQREQRFLRMFTPISIGLFVIGVAFMYFIVLPIVLNFFVGFGQRIVVTDVQPSALQTWLIGKGTEDEASQPPPVEAGIPTRETDPVDPPLGSAWINASSSLLCVQTKYGVFSVPMERIDRVAAVKSQFALKDYVGFVLALSLAFGLAFEVPLVVVFLASTGIVTVDQMAKARRYVIFGIVVAGAILTPPDVLSQLLLAVPMVLLFEIALQVAKVVVRRKEAGAAAV